jgi:hypothetical protein
MKGGKRNEMRDITFTKRKTKKRGKQKNGCKKEKKINAKLKGNKLC